MVSVRRGFGETFALWVAVGPLLNTLVAAGAPFTVVAVGSLALATVATILLVERGPDHDSGTVWRFAGYTFVGYAVVQAVAERAFTYSLAEAPFAAVAVWSLAASVALALVARR